MRNRVKGFKWDAWYDFNTKQFYQQPECDNKTQAHLMVEMGGRGGIKAYCKLCRRTYYLRTNKNGAPDKRQYAKLFYRDIVQPNKPLYYKIHRDRLRLGNI